MHIYIYIYTQTIAQQGNRLNREKRSVADGLTVLEQYRCTNVQNTNDISPSSKSPSPNTNNNTFNDQNHNKHPKKNRKQTSTKRKQQKQKKTKNRKRKKKKNTNNRHRNKKQDHDDDEYGQVLDLSSYDCTPQDEPQHNDIETPVHDATDVTSIDDYLYDTQQQFKQTREYKQSQQDIIRHQIPDDEVYLPIRPNDDSDECQSQVHQRKDSTTPPIHHHNLRRSTRTTSRTRNRNNRSITDTDYEREANDELDYYSKIRKFNVCCTPSVFYML